MEFIPSIIIEFLKWFLKTQDVPHLAPWKWFLIFSTIIGLYFSIKIWWRQRKIMYKIDANPCNKGQAQRVFKLIMQCHRREIESFVFRTRERIRLTNSKDVEILSNDFIMFFRNLQEEAINDLNFFKYENKHLGEFLENCSVEYQNIHSHLLKAVLSETEEIKDAPYSLSTTFKSMNTSFEKWLNKSKGNEDENRIHKV